MKKVASLIGLTAAVLAACANHAGVKVPPALEPASNETISMIVRAKGVQIYECRSKGAGETEWAFVAPEADLYDLRGHPVGHHFAGPVWESSDGSAVRGSVKARADAPQAGAIPWLLLGTKSVGDARGAFSGVTAIQRLNTSGGVAPAGGCDANAIGKPARVAYTADYVLFSVR